MRNGTGVPAESEATVRREPADGYGMTDPHDITPDDAVEQYLQSRHDVLQSTLDRHEYRLRYFTEWARENEIETLTELDGFDLQRYKNWRIAETDCNLVTIEQHLHTLRVFLRWCESSDVVSKGLAHKVVIPNVSSQDKARDVALTAEEAQTIIDYLVDHEWARTPHILFHTLYHCGMRRSGLHALDVDDWHPEERYLSIRNRPESGTRIKLGDEGERNVSVTDNRLASALNDYIDVHRPAVTDDHGRRPLLASQHGRYHYQTLTAIAYQVTRPCWYSGGCPHDRSLEECDARDYAHHSTCPSSVSTHPLRRSSITHHLSEDVPKEIVSERMSLTVDVLETHYDARDKEQRRENRMNYLLDKDL